MAKSNQIGIITIPQDFDPETVFADFIARNPDYEKSELIVLEHPYSPYIGVKPGMQFAVYMYHKDCPFDLRSSTIWETPNFYPLGALGTLLSFEQLRDKFRPNSTIFSPDLPTSALWSMNAEGAQSLAVHIPDGPTDEKDHVIDTIPYGSGQNGEEVLLFKLLPSLSSCN